MGQAPVPVVHEDPAMTKQKGKKLLALLASILCCGFARTDEITHRFVDRVRYPNRRQFTSTKQSRKRHRIAPVCLDPVTSFLGNQRWRYDGAIVTQSANLNRAAT